MWKMGRWGSTWGVDLVVRRFYRRAIERILCARAEGEGPALYR